MTEVVSALFQILPWGMQDVEVVGGDCAANDGNYGAEDVWIGTKLTRYRSYEEQLGSVLDLVIFSLLEPLTLGFLPFQTEEGVGDISSNRPFLTVGGTAVPIHGYVIPIENLRGVHVGNDGIGRVSYINDILRGSMKVIATE